MLDRLVMGEVPPKHHVALRGPDGQLRYEECLTRVGFDGPYSILYHLNRPHALVATSTSPVMVSSASPPLSPAGLRRRHYRTSDLHGGGSAIDARTPLLCNPDLTLLIVRPNADTATYFCNGDGDELFFVRVGSGLVRSVFGDLRFEPGDYVCVPRGTIYRFVFDGTDVDLLLIECRGGVGIPKQWRNEVGQLRMDAPYSHRDFKRPVFRGPLDEGIRDVRIKRHDAHHGFRLDHAPLDVVGWDGAVYPWAFPILAFQPRVSSVHLPPIWHGTFAARGALVCSFVPRPLDFHPEAIPCPYPHTSVDVDEVIYYVRGDFTSRTGVQAGSLTLHPSGIPHGPHPGRYEASLGRTHTDEIAVMLDCYQPLVPTIVAGAIEDPDYDGSFARAPQGGE